MMLPASATDLAVCPRSWALPGPVWTTKKTHIHTYTHTHTHTHIHTHTTHTRMHTWIHITCTHFCSNNLRHHVRSLQQSTYHWIDWITVCLCWMNTVLFISWQCIVAFPVRDTLLKPKNLLDMNLESLQLPWNWKDQFTFKHTSKKNDSIMPTHLCATSSCW